jgi:transposase
MKATGIRGFNPKLKKAAERLEGLRTPEGEPVPPNTLAELHRDMERRHYAIRSGRSRAHAWIASIRQPARERIPWCVCWRA